MGFEGRMKGKYKGTERFVEKIKEIQKKAKAVLSQTSFGHIFTNSSTIPTVSKRA